jgi:trimeric autotransporter adhesin
MCMRPSFLIQVFIGLSLLFLQRAAVSADPYALPGAGVGSFIGGGSFNTATGDYSTVGAGWANSASGRVSSILGGEGNQCTLQYGAIGGGYYNKAGYSSSVGGGVRNEASNYSAIAGGWYNFASGRSSFVGGGAENLATGERAVIGGGWDNVSTATHSAVLGGYSNSVGGFAGMVGGGTTNRTDGSYGVVAGGFTNGAFGDYSTVGGGYINTASGIHSTVAGGYVNSATNTESTVCGGFVNVATGQYSVVAGGYNNSATGLTSTVVGGAYNTASGGHSFAAGKHAKATHYGSFVWADATNYHFASQANHQFSVRSTGGARFVSAIDGSGVPTAGVRLTSGGGSWSSISDRNAKANITVVNGRAVLAALASLPISKWNYRSQDAAIRHIGPMAQDFAKAFDVGEDDKLISTVDADGVAFAAIQGLHEELQLRDKQILEQKRTIVLQQAMLEKLEARLTKLEHASHR